MFQLHFGKNGFHKMPLTVRKLNKCLIAHGCLLFWFLCWRNLGFFQTSDMPNNSCWIVSFMHKLITKEQIVFTLCIFQVKAFCNFFSPIWRRIRWSSLLKSAKPGMDSANWTMRSYWLPSSADNLAKISSLVCNTKQIKKRKYYVIQSVQIVFYNINEYIHENQV